MLMLRVYFWAAAKGGASRSREGEPAFLFSFFFFFSPIYLHFVSCGKIYDIKFTILTTF